MATLAPPAVRPSIDAMPVPARAPAAAAPARPRDLFEGGSWRALSVLTDGFVLIMAAWTGLRMAGVSAQGALVAPLLVVAAGPMVRMAATGMYGPRPGLMSLLDTVRSALAAAGAAAVAALALAAVMGVTPEGVGALLWASAYAAVLLAASRLVLALARRSARVRGVSGKNAIIVGAGVIGSQLERRLRTTPELGLRPVGYLDADPVPDVTGDRRAPVLGGPDDLAAAVARTGAEHVIIAFSSAPDSTVQPLVRRCEQLGVEVSVVPRLFENVNDRQWVEHIGGLPLCGLRRVDPKSWQFACKHLLDRSVAALLMLVAGPLMAAIALAVKLSSPGPVFFRQTRVGRDGQVFDILKFRSMRVAPKGGESELARRLHAVGSAPGGVEGDDRRTRVGTFIRRTSLDELPQLLNVLCGRMSLVGPRPERPEFVELFGTRVRRYGDRHQVKSGMTGWAQVHGLRGQTSLSERIEWDNWYIQNWSLWLDLKIMLMTPLALIAPEDPAPAPAAAPAAPDRVEPTFLAA